MRLPEKAPVVGTPISITSYEEVIAAIVERSPDRALSVAVCNVHSVMSARRDPRLRAALVDSDIATPDGMPLVWALRWTVRPDQQRVYGPELMRRALTSTTLNHYLYGATPETLEALITRIADIAPNARIAGQYSPPFRALTEEESASIEDVIRQSGADVVWVGLGMPKQELWMADVRDRLPGFALVGVGAAFDFLAGTKRQAPSWMQRAGLEWLFRLIQEPRRLWRRYLWNNPAFMLLLARQVLFDRRHG
jgi:N-acetylglucosaminyldiphosphoundecaprenol N-acetyl-beta-D-mannosaminyltransferase